MTPGVWKQDWCVTAKFTDEKTNYTSADNK